tara:strand:- start:2206 stop:3540 length:1335 start_codon:yes stop_codon:yes gene_type:complete
MKPYIEYVDSNIEGLTKVPSSWQVMRFRHLFSIDRGLSITKENLQDYGIPCVNYGEIHSKYGFELDLDKHPLKCVDEGYLNTSQNSLLHKGDLIYADTSEDLDGAGNFTQLVSDQKTFAGYHTVIARQTKNHDDRFIAYALDATYCRNQIRRMVKGVKVFSITQAILKDLSILLPSYEEQRAISKYLDTNTTRIDNLIDEKESFINLLQEKRQALISHVVTKGLDENAKMKPSGVEWIGDIPEHWNTGSLGFYGSVTSGSTPDRNNETYWDGNIPWIKTGEIKYNTITFAEEKVTEKALLDSSIKLSPKGTILMAMYGQGNTRGRVAILGIDATYNQACAAITVDKRLTNTFLFYFYIAAYDYLRLEGNLTSQTNLNAEIIKKFKIVIPPVNEQKDIVEYIEKKLQKYDVLQDEALNSIKLLREQRTALISAAVTGKIDVRETV